MNDICNNCNIKKICINYEYLKEHDELTISNCKYKTNETNNIYNNNKKNNLFDWKPNYGFSFSNETIPLIKKEEDKTKSEYTITKLITCPSCNEIAPATDIIKCAKCGVECCSSCGIDDVIIKEHTDEVEQVRLCNECYYGKDYNKEDAYDSNMSLTNILSINKKSGDDKRNDKEEKGN